MHPPSKNAPAAFLRARHRLADSGLRLDPCAGCRFGLERTGERMLGAAQRHADEKTWHVVCAHPVLIQDECDEHLVSHCVLSKLLAQPLHRSPVPDLVCPDLPDENWQRKPRTCTRGFKWRN